MRSEILRVLQPLVNDKGCTIKHIEAASFGSFQRVTMDGPNGEDIVLDERNGQFTMTVDYLTRAQLCDINEMMDFVEEMTF